MDDNYKRYNKLFLNGQESYYLGDYSTCYKPFITAEGKLKYTSPHPDNPKDKQTKHIKYKLDDLRRHLVEVECILIEGALRKSDGSVTAASKSLKINRTTLIEKMKKYSIPRVGND